MNNSWTVSKVLSYFLVAALAVALTYIVMMKTQDETEVASTPATMSSNTSERTAAAPVAHSPTPVTPEPSTASLATDSYSTANYSYSTTIDYNNSTSIFKRKNTKTGVETTLISNLDAQVSGLRPSQTLSVFAQPKNSTKVILSVILPDSDAPRGDLYAFDTTTQKITKMEINSVWKGGFSFNSDLSEDQTKLAFTDTSPEGAAKKIFVCSFISDICRTVAEASTGESFGISGGLDSTVNIVWAGTNLIKAEVFEDTGSREPGKSKGMRNYEVQL